MKQLLLKLFGGLFKGTLEHAAEQKAEEWLDGLHDKNPDIHAAVLHILNDAVSRLRPLAEKTETEIDDEIVQEVEKIIAEQANKYGISLGTVAAASSEEDTTDPEDQHGHEPGN